MTKHRRISFFKNCLILWLLLWSAPAFGGSPEVTPSLECKVAVSLVKLALIDVNEAFKALGQAIEKTGRALEDESHVIKSYQQALDSSGKPPSDEPLNQARATMKRAYDSEASSSQHLKQAIQGHDQRFADAIARCGGLR